MRRAVSAMSMGSPTGLHRRMASGGMSHVVYGGYGLAGPNSGLALPGQGTGLDGSGEFNANAAATAGGEYDGRRSSRTFDLTAAEGNDDSAEDALVAALQNSSNIHNPAMPPPLMIPVAMPVVPETVHYSTHGTNEPPTPVEPTRPPTLAIPTQNIPGMTTPVRYLPAETPGMGMTRNYSGKTIYENATARKWIPRYAEDVPLPRLSEEATAKLNAMGEMGGRVAVAAQLITFSMWHRETTFFGKEGFRRSISLLHTHPAYVWVFRVITLVYLAMTLFEPPSYRHALADDQHWVDIVCAFCVALLIIDIVIYATHYGTKKSIRAVGHFIYVLAVAACLVDVILNLTIGVSFRFSRVLRPLFYIAQGRSARRAMYVIFRSSLPVLLVIMALLVIVVMFAYMGVVLFQGQYVYDEATTIPGGDFNTTSSAMVVLFVLTTTENYPAILYPVFDHLTKWSVVYFISYSMLSIMFVALLIGIALESYKEQHLDMVRRGLIKEKRNFIAAFLLLDEKNKGTIGRDEFKKIFDTLNPNLPERLGRLLFKVLDTDGTQEIDAVEFTYLANVLRWSIRFERPEDQAKKWTVKIIAFCDKYFHWLKKITHIRGFEMLRRILVLVNAVWLCCVNEYGWARGNRWVEIMLMVLLWLDIFVSLVRMGPRFFTSFWVRFDVLVTTTATVLFILYGVGVTSVFVNVSIFRLVDIFHVTRTKNSSGEDSRLYKLEHQLGMFAMGLRQSGYVVLALGVIVLSAMYVFSIIGMEIFEGAFDARESLYSNKPANFDTWGSAMLTLYQMLLVNNFNDIMYAAIAGTTRWAAFYFVAYYVVVVVLLLNMVTTLIIDAFMRRTARSDQNEMVINLPNSDVIKIKIRMLWSRELVAEQLDALEQECFGLGVASLERVLMQNYRVVDFNITPTGKQTHNKDFPPQPDHPPPPDTETSSTSKEQIMMDSSLTDATPAQVSIGFPEVLPSARDPHDPNFDHSSGFPGVEPPTPDGNPHIMIRQASDTPNAGSGGMSGGSSAAPRAFDDRGNAFPSQPTPMGAQASESSPESARRATVGPGAGQRMIANNALARRGSNTPAPPPQVPPLNIGGQGTQSQFYSYTAGSGSTTATESPFTQPRRNSLQVPTPTARFEPSPGAATVSMPTITTATAPTASLLGNVAATGQSARQEPTITEEVFVASTPSSARFNGGFPATSATTQGVNGLAVNTVEVQMDMLASPSPRGNNGGALGTSPAGLTPPDQSMPLGALKGSTSYSSESSTSSGDEK